MIYYNQTAKFNKVPTNQAKFKLNLNFTRRGTGCDPVGMVSEAADTFVVDRIVVAAIQVIIILVAERSQGVVASLVSHRAVAAQSS